MGNVLDLAAWILLSALAGTVKVRFPAIDTCYSLGYVVVLGAVALLDFSQVITVSCVTAIAQCYWRPTKQPMPVQVLFNVFNYVISAAASWHSFHGLQRLAPGIGMPVRFAFGAGVFFLLNTGLVSWILAIMAKSPFMDVWERSHLLIFPFYVMGAACAAVFVSQTGITAWTLFAVCPFFYLVYLSTRAWVRKSSTINYRTAER
jgi:hypothetical protein